MGFIFFSRIVIIRIYFPWKVISKKYFSWTVMRILSPNHLCESAINFNSFSNINFFTIINLDLNLFIFYIEINDFHPAFVPCKWIGDCYIHFGDKSIELKLDLLAYIHPPFSFKISTSINLSKLGKRGITGIVFLMYY